MPFSLLLITGGLCAVDDTSNPRNGHTGCCGYVALASTSLGCQANCFGAVAKLGGEQRRLSFSFPDGRCVWALLGRLEDPVDDHRVRVRLPVGKHRALPFPQ